MSEKLLYVVTQGCYSDYRVIAIFDEEELANLCVSDINKKDKYEEAGIEMFPLNPYRIALQNGYSFFFVSMYKDGEVRDIHEHQFIQDAKPNFYPRKIKEDKKSRTFEYDSFGIGVAAKDEEHAIKIVNEKRTQLIAMNEWPKNSRYKKDELDVFVNELKDSGSLTTEAEARE